MPKKIMHSTRQSRASGKHHRMGRESASHIRQSPHRRDQQAGGPDHKGGEAHEDRNP